jgi:hypothetical protein
MFTREEIKENLLGCLEVSLLMPHARTRFGKTYDEALKSFFIPVIFFPLTLLFIYAFPSYEASSFSSNNIALLYSLRLAASSLLFFGTVYMILNQIDRKGYFCQFVSALNWLTIPSTVIFIPVAWLLFTGSYTLEELTPFIHCLIWYSYIFTAFMSAYILRIPWEFACFIVFLSIALDEKTLKLLKWFGTML